MIISRRMQVGIAELPAYLAAGWVEVMRLPGGCRLDGETAIVEWRGPVEPTKEANTLDDGGGRDVT